MLAVANAGVFKWIRVGRYQSKVVDYANYGESAPGRYFDYYYHPGAEDVPFATNHSHAIGWYVGARDWTDADENPFPHKISGAAHGTADEQVNTIPVPDAEGLTIRKYFRSEPVSIVVDGRRLDPLFPQEGEEVNPAKTGTADRMVESWVNTSMGLTLHQKVYAWSQINHDQYHIFDCTFINTGNTDADAEIELPDQTLLDVYFLRVNYWRSGKPGWSYIDIWESDYGKFPGDSLRIMYAYPGRELASSFDNTGSIISLSEADSPVLRDPAFKGEAYLHVDKSVSDKTDDITQPAMTGYWHIDDLYSKSHSHSNSQTLNSEMYGVMSEGFIKYGAAGTNPPEVPGTHPGHHSVPLDERGIAYVRDVPWYIWLPGAHAAMGPYTLAPEDSFRVVFARVFGSISYEKAWEIGKQFRAGTADDNFPATMGSLDVTNPKLMPPYVDNYATLVPDDNSLAKDIWIFTGKDSLFKNTAAAQWNVQKNYDIPIPPPAPSIEVTSLPDRINITWGNESEAPTDFAGYKVYRTTGRYDSTMVLLETFSGDGTHTYDDITAERGQAYYYYVAAYDNGVANAPDWHGKSEVLESGRYLNQTTFPAYLTRTPKTLDDVVVVPNPFNISAASLQYGQPNKIMFLDLPGYCTIKIYTESGDLVREIEHDDGSGDEAWGVLEEEYSASATGQIIVSGIYIAFIEEKTSEGELTGKNTFVKFVVVR